MTIAQIEEMIVGRSDNGDNPISTERDLWRAIRNEACKLFEVKCIQVNTTANPSYLGDNFDNTGLGINDMDGFAICNGENGTYDHTGRVMIGYGPGYATIGNTGGSKDQVVVAHTHSVEYSTHNAAGGGSERVLQVGGGGFQNTSSAGIDGADKNMQPYIITLMIQRIA